MCNLIYVDFENIFLYISFTILVGEAGLRPASLKFQTLIPDAENRKMNILSHSETEKYIVSTSNNVDFVISWPWSFNL